MLVRLKKRGPWPHGVMSPVLDLFRGCCFEVVPSEIYRDDECSGLRDCTWCSGKTYVITDGRYLALRPRPTNDVYAICEHCLIDDLEAYDSDYFDAEAQEGDLACAHAPAVRKVPRG